MRQSRTNFNSAASRISCSISGCEAKNLLPQSENRNNRTPCELGLTVATLLLRLQYITGHGPENQLWLSIDGPGRAVNFLLAPGGPGCKSAGPSHL